MRRVVRNIVGAGMAVSLFVTGCGNNAKVAETTAAETEAASEAAVESKTVDETETKAEVQDETEEADSKSNQDIKWIGNYQAADGKSITVTGADESSLNITLVSYSEDGWTEKDYKLNIDKNDARKATMDPKYGLGGVEFNLTDNGIELKADLMMADTYNRTDGYTDASVNAKHVLNDGNTYDIAGITLDDETVENFARNLRIEILHDDFESIVEKAKYPFRIDDNYYNDEATLLNRLEQYGFPESFKKRVAREDCRDMLATARGVMLGDGDVWFGPDSSGLVVTAFNFKGVSTGSELDVTENLSKVDVYDYYLSTLVPGQYYTEIDTGLQYPILLVTDEVNSDRTATKANVCYPIGNLIYLVGEIESPLEGYPIRFDATGLYCTDDHYLLKYNFDDESRRVIPVGGVEDHTMVENAKEGTFYAVDVSGTAEITETEFNNYCKSVNSVPVILFNPAG